MLGHAEHTEKWIRSPAFLLLLKCTLSRERFPKLSIPMHAELQGILLDAREGAGSGVRPEAGRGAYTLGRREVVD
jgi:hypothetical protein